MKKDYALALPAWAWLIVLASVLPNLPAAAGTAGPVGLVVTGEERCSGYDRGDYPYPQSVERRIVDSMGGRIYGPYEGRTFASTRQTQIEHIVALSEAHDSGLCDRSDSVKRRFARDLDNLTLASPKVNQSKGGRDAAEWRPAHNACWFAGRVVAVKVKYGLTVDREEANTLSSILNGCKSKGMLDDVGDPLSGASFSAAAPQPSGLPSGRLGACSLLVALGASPYAAFERCPRRVPHPRTILDRHFPNPHLAEMP